MTRSERDKLIEDNLGLVGHICKTVYPSCIGPNFDDFFQIGCLGLITAADRFDPDKDIQFSTFAYKHIAGAIARAIKKDYAPNNDVISIDSTVPGTDELVVADIVADETDEYDRIFVEEDRFLKTLDDKDRYIWNRRKDGATFAQIGEELGITHQGVQHHLNKIRKLWKQFSRVKG